jgi:hypothetical protein
MRHQKKSRLHKDRIRASMLARYARIRAALGVTDLKEIGRAS